MLHNHNIHEMNFTFIRIEKLALYTRVGYKKSPSAMLCMYYKHMTPLPYCTEASSYVCNIPGLNCRTKTKEFLVTLKIRIATLSNTTT